MNGRPQEGAWKGGHKAGKENETSGKVAGVRGGGGGKDEPNMLGRQAKPSTARGAAAAEAHDGTSTATAPNSLLKENVHLPKIGGQVCCPPVLNIPSNPLLPLQRPFSVDLQQ